MDTQKFQAARLIPTTGIKGDLDQERRTTSAFLAVLVAVPEFAKILLKPLGAGAGKITTYIEPEFESGEGKIRPDGLIVVERGAKRWTCLVEVKTGKNPLKADQLNAYLDLCKANNIDALWTISNEVLTLSGEHPTSGVDGRKLRKTVMVHYSWVRILTEALLQRDFRGVSDPDQAWILNELVRYLQHPASGALEFSDMGEFWVPVRQSIIAGTLAANDKGAPEVIRSFESLMRFVAFRLSAKLGVEAREVAPKLAKSDPKKHLAAESSSLVSKSLLQGQISIPNTASNLYIKADIRAGQVICSASISAPNEGRAQTRINWLLRQLKTAPAEIRIETNVKRSSAPTNIELLGKALANPAILIPADNREISGFTIAWASKMGTKRGDDSGSFIFSVVSAAENFYQEVFEHLRPWVAKAPKISSDGSSPNESPFDPEFTDAPLPE